MRREMPRGNVAGLLPLAVAVIAWGCSRDVEVASNLLYYDRVARTSTVMHEWSCSEGPVDRDCAISGDGSVYTLSSGQLAVSGTQPYGGYFQFEPGFEPATQDLTVDGEIPAISGYVCPYDASQPYCPRPDLVNRIPVVVQPAAVGSLLVAITDPVPAQSLVSIVLQGSALWKSRLSPPGGGLKDRTNGVDYLMVVYLALVANGTFSLTLASPADSLFRIDRATGKQRLVGTRTDTLGLKDVPPGQGELFHIVRRAILPHP